MNTEIIAALIGAAATLLTWLPAESFFSFWWRKKQAVPNITGTRWEATWHLENGEVHLVDRVVFKKWTRGAKFVGNGTAIQGGREFVYVIDGEISPQGIVVLTYRGEDYPTQANFIADSD